MAVHLRPHPAGLPDLLQGRSRPPLSASSRVGSGEAEPGVAARRAGWRKAPSRPRPLRGSTRAGPRTRPVPLATFGPCPILVRQSQPGPGPTTRSDATSEQDGSDIWHIVHASWAWLLTVASLGCFLPWTIAASRRKSNTVPIALVNLLLGLDARRMDDRTRHGLRRRAVHGRRARGPGERPADVRAWLSATAAGHVSGCTPGRLGSGAPKQPQRAVAVGAQR
jgi:hypothetical protein